MWHSVLIIHVVTSKDILCSLFQAIVLLVGTNNYDHTAEQVSGGILEIIATIQQKQPSAHIVVMVKFQKQ